MSKTTSLNSHQKLGLKILYTLTWGAIAACSSEVVSSRQTLSIHEWAIFSSVMAAIALSGAAVFTKDIRISLTTLAGAIAGIVAGCMTGALVCLTQWKYPAVFPSVLAAVALLLNTWLMDKNYFNRTLFARGSSNSAFAIVLVLTVVSMLTGGFTSVPMLVPFFAAPLAFWVVLLCVAFVDAQPVTAKT